MQRHKRIAWGRKTKMTFNWLFLDFARWRGFSGKLGKKKEKKNTNNFSPPADIS
jgi:hypothetical protein